MRQIGSEKDDPLKRIQEEINEVARRERELREKIQLQQQQQQLPIENGIATSPTPSTIDDSTIQVPINNGKSSLDETHSDDSGISASSSPVNGISASSDKRYIRPNGYTSIPTPPAQKLLVRAMSTPQIFTPNRRFSFHPTQKGLMQRFIASRGKLGGTGQQGRDSASQILQLDHNRSNGFMSSVTASPPIIERDADGRPIRRGFVPVEEKIQKELKDLKNRETELKRIRKINSRQSQPDLLDSIEDESLESDDDSDVEHCFPPGKLRTSKSIGELCDALNSISPIRTTPSPDFDRKTQQCHQNGMRPAVSLALLCDLDPQEAPSSHQLIAKWESLIQQNA